MPPLLNIPTVTVIYERNFISASGYPETRSSVLATDIKIKYAADLIIYYRQIPSFWLCTSKVTDHDSNHDSVIRAVTLHKT